MLAKLKENKKAIIKSLLVILVIVGIALSCYFILRALGFTEKEKFIELKGKLGDSFLFWLIVALLQIVQVIFIPVSNQLITVPVALIFNDELWKVFIASWIGITIATIILYFIGRYGGTKILKWILGDEKKVDQCKEFMQRGKSFYILGNVIPFLPNDLLSVLAGMSKYPMCFTFITIIITRAICIATSVWGFGSIIKYPFVIAILAVGIVIMLVITILLLKKQKKEYNKGVREDN